MALRDAYEISTALAMPSRQSLIKEYPIDDSASFASDLPGTLTRKQAETIKRILLARGIHSGEDLNLSLGALDKPEGMAGLSAATEILESSLREQKRVLICGDYDADGATSTALLIRVLRQTGLKNIDFLVPNRFDFGYGLSVELVDVALESKPDLIVTVDNGISSIEGVAHARASGIDVLVTDHHLPGAELPNANVIVNPNLPGCNFPSRNLAGVGVAFYLSIALRAKLRESGWFADQGIAEPRLEQFLDIVALGTVADVVVLDRLNRILVAQGLKLIRSGRGNPGIRKLFAVSGRELSTAKSTDLGFAIGPRINAAGRLDDIARGILCLLTDDEQRAHELALEMQQMNLERRQIQDGMMAEAERALKVEETRHQVGDDSLAWGYCCYQDDWHQGLVGLVAARIKERLHRPVIAFARGAENGGCDAQGVVGHRELKGSARSIPGLHIRDCLERVASQNPGLIKKLGGHALAAGLTIDETAYEQFSLAFDQAVHSLLSAGDLAAVTWVDGELDNSSLSMDFASYIEGLLPWGQGVPEPQFSGNFEVAELRWLRETHLKLKLSQEGSSQVLDAIWFHAPTDIIKRKQDRFCAVYRPKINRYMGRKSLQLQIVTGFSLSD